MAGIYIHIPFCKQACSYCDFHFSTNFEKNRTQLIDSICRELEIRKDYLTGETIKTIYFGGGTPSLLRVHEIEAILNSISNNFETDSEMEVTLEVNPDDVSENQLNNWKKCGVNRLSIGVQSFLKADLAWMNRAHNENESQKAIELAKSHGFLLTIDLIYGLPNTSLKKWDYNIQKAIDVAPEHISAYCLTVEQKTTLAKWVKDNKIKPADEDEQASQFLYLVDKLSEHGYEQYEVSNFARDGHYAKHNSNYWLGINYLGVGPSAHSFDGKSRSWNIANNAQYIKKITENQSFFEVEQLSNKNRFNEYLMTGLRTKWGVDFKKLNTIHNIPNAIMQKIDNYEKEGYLNKESDKLILTNKGKLIADQIASELFID